MKDILTKYREIITYIIVGFITTAINMLTYLLSTRLLILDEMISNNIAWFVALFFSFIANKIIVFRSKDYSIMTISKEFIKFSSGRYLTLLLDNLIVYVGIKILLVNDIYVQIIKQIIITIINYVLGKISFR